MSTPSSLPSILRKRDACTAAIHVHPSHSPLHPAEKGHLHCRQLRALRLQRSCRHLARTPALPQLLKHSPPLRKRLLRVCGALPLLRKERDGADGEVLVGRVHGAGRQRLHRRLAAW
eukprot:358476-Chlamydomonas_euryale.AAC.1